MADGIVDGTGYRKYFTSREEFGLQLCKNCTISSIMARNENRKWSEPFVRVNQYLYFNVCELQNYILAVYFKFPGSEALVKMAAYGIVVFEMSTFDNIKQFFSDF